VFIADLSAARDEAGAARAVASAAGLSHQEIQGDPSGWVAGQLRGKRLLVILDTCEHIVEAGAALADTILRGGGPALLATSRQPLDLPGEVVFRIPPLAAGTDGPDGDAAVNLFEDRAAAAVPGFALTPDTLPAVVRLCRLLDGVPLAIELAALRLRAIGLHELLDRLPGHLRLLGSARRAVADGRQQSLLASVTWSYDLCTPAERLLWSRLSVFADGFDLAAAEAVCSGGELGADAVLDTLVGLVDKSVVLRAADTGGTARYRLLGVVREHGAEQAEDGAYAERHRDYYRGVARDFAASFTGPGQLGLVAALDRDDANLRAAFAATLAAGDAALALEFAVACWPWHVCAGRLAEAGAWLSRALWPEQGQAGQPERPPASVSGLASRTGPGSQPARLRELAFRQAAWGLAAQGDIRAADELQARLPAAQRPAAAAPAAERAGRGPDPGVLPRAGAGSRAPGAGGIQLVIVGLEAAFGALRRGAFADCAARCDDLSATLPAGERWARGWVAWIKGLAGWFTGDRVVAGVRLRASLELLAPFGGERAVALHLEAFAWLAAGRGDFRRTARLQGAADQIWQRLTAGQGVTAPRFGLPLLHAERDRAEGEARDALGPAGYAAEHAAGAALSLDAAIKNVMPGAPSAPPLRASAISGPGELRDGPPQALARRGAGFAGPPGGAPPTPEGAPEAAPADAAFAGRWELLTAREREVAGLVALGMTNKDIAARLVVSKRTVDAHLEHILGKLGYSSRVQVAALASHERDRQHRERERQRRQQARRELDGRDEPGRDQPARVVPGQSREERPAEQEWPVPSPRQPRGDAYHSGHSGFARPGRPD
jgi:non-specific serine/threonine protein kinase